MLGSAMSKRIERVGDLLQKTLAELFRREVKDPRLQMLSITGVDVTGDLGHATIYISVIDDHNRVEDVLKVLEKAKSSLRSLLAKECQLRTIPELHFKHDTSAAYSEKISELIQKARKKDGR